MSTPTLGQVVYSFFIDHLQVAKGLRPSSIMSYRDGVRLFLRFVADDLGCTITRLPLVALTPEQAGALAAELDQRKFSMPGLAR